MERVPQADELFVSFRHQPAAFPRDCALRFVFAASGLVERFDRQLQRLDAARAHRCRSRAAAVAGRAMRLVEGSLADLEGLFGALDAPDGSAAGGEGDGPFPEPVLRSARRAYALWSRREFVLPLPRGRSWRLDRRVRILGILNVTPDSFSDGGRYLEADEAVRHGLEMLEQGADALDIGGESTRPGASVVPVDEEVRRTAPVVAALRAATDAPLSIDTSKAAVARAALDAGADIVNDVTALAGDPAMAELLARRPDVPFVLMHMRGTPRNMQDDPRYDDATAEILGYLGARLDELVRCGLERSRALVDPGFGFGKRTQDNVALLRELGEFRSLGCPLLIGLSRKSFLGRVMGSSPGEREAATVAAHVVASLAGAAVLRTHDVSKSLEMVKLLEALRPSGA